MVRELRMECAGGFYHVISRGNQGDFIFKEDRDKEYFLGLLHRGAVRFDALIYAFCIMGNHYHLLLETRDANLSSLMHFINSSFASCLREKGRIGHIFSGRYKSICAEKDEHALSLSKYVHLNPVRAGIVDRAEDYPWSSYRYFVEAVAAPEWLFKDWITRYFECPEIDIRSRYKAFVEEDDSGALEYPGAGAVANSVLGSESFMRRIMSEVDEDKLLTTFKGKERLLRKVSLEELIERVRARYGLVDLSVCGSGASRDITFARRVFIFLAREYANARNKEISRMLGGISSSAVTQHYQHVMRKMSENGKEGRFPRSEIEAVILTARGCSKAGNRCKNK